MRQSTMSMICTDQAQQRNKEGQLKLDHSKTRTGIKQQYVRTVETTYKQNRAYDSEA